MRNILVKFKPANGFAHALHLGFVTLLPVAVFVLVRINFVQLAIIIIILSKWRMFAVRPRYWLANIRANSVDIIVGVSFLIFMLQSGSMGWQLIWMVAYGFWLLVIKPSANVLVVSLQASIGQLMGLMALFLDWPTAPLYGLVIAAGGICYLSARHYFDSFEEPYSKFLSYLWGYFGAALVWITGHWLLFYGVIAQPTLLLLVLGYGLGTLYYLDHNDRLSKLLKREFVFIMVAIVIVVLAFSHWGNKIV
ncbi:MAG TPA: hypothetical protein VMR95_02730 [Candidatus Binatia bacterium]|nr:hypothetical protein [Candidatus Binatia bacterium]